MKPKGLHGVMAEFNTPDELVSASHRAYQAGYRKMDAYSPFAIEELSEAIGFHHTRLPLIVLVGGIIACIGGMAMQYWMAAVDYPVNVGGRPLNSWPAFIPVMFELTVLIASLAAVFGLLGLCGLPRPHHPLFNVEAFARATRDRFFLCIEARDPRFDAEATRAFLTALHPSEVTEVPD